ncbi:MAG: type I methionyl aminopeptidase [Clostridia bacterium]|nr:type I methionyl aminopeptidase [Clostridia bacterium]MBQ9847584.1 type I methionyl aminopeptidase [Clostridia bacterium]
MITLKSGDEIIRMRDAGRIAAIAREIGGECVREGVTTAQIDREIKKSILSHGAKPSFLGYGGFPASACISVNEEIIHGIPSSNRVLKNGDIVKIDVGAFYKGYHGDCAATFTVGNVSEEAQRLISVTKESFFKGIAAIKDGARLGDIGYAIQSYVESFGFSVVREYIGHGIGRKLHEDPEVPNYGTAGRGQRLREGMTIAIEPMVNAGDWNVRVLDDEWTVVTADGKLSAHYENTVAITANGVLILTDPS